jgi:hypothetical protein
VAFDEYTSTQKVKAEQIEEAKSVITPNGPMAAQAGQWEVRYPDGNVQVVDDEQFQTAFGSGEKSDVAEAEPTVDEGGIMPLTAQPEENPEETEETTEEESEDEAAEPEPKQKTKAQAPPKPS